MGRQHRIYIIKCVPNGKAYVGSASHKAGIKAGWIKRKEKYGIV